MQSLFNTHADPRTCPSHGAKQCTYMQWFAHADRAVYHPHIKYTTITSGKHRDLMRCRLGCADIAVNSGRFVAKQIKKARSVCICPCCCSGQPEDELHVVFECTAYNSIRSQNKFAGLFDSGHSMKALFCLPHHQSILSDFIRSISLRRKQLVAA